MMIIENKEYLTAAEAAAVLTKNSGRTISQDYVRDLARRKRLSALHLSDKFAVYPRSEVEQLRIRPTVGRPKGSHNRPKPQKKMEPSLVG